MLVGDTPLCDQCGQIMVRYELKESFKCLNCGQVKCSPNPKPSVGRIVHYWPNAVERSDWQRKIGDFVAPRLDEPFVGRVVSVCRDEPQFFDAGRIVMVVDLPPHVEYVVACYSLWPKHSHWSWPERK